MSRLLSEVEFASFLVYAPRPAPECATRCLQVRNGVKFDTNGIIKLAARRIAERWSTTALDDFLGRDVLIVPAPGSSPAMTNALSPPQRICDELAAANLAAESRPLIQRVLPIRKSATASDRPRLEEQVATLRSIVTTDVLAYTRVTIVDDFITSGTTLLACAEVLQAALPQAVVRTFGLVRTLSEPGTLIEHPIEPCRGTIKYDSSTDRCRRRP